MGGRPAKDARNPRELSRVVLTHPSLRSIILKSMVILIVILSLFCFLVTYTVTKPVIWNLIARERSPPQCKNPSIVMPQAYGAWSGP